MIYRNIMSQRLLFSEFILSPIVRSAYVNFIKYKARKPKQENHVINRQY